MAKLKESHDAVRGLVENFESHKAAYLRPDYSESQLRSDFIDKLLTSLGWDVGHVHQKNPFKQEVKVEKIVSDKGAKKRADYAFLIAPNFRDPRLYIEAKKPSVDVATADNYFQAIRYGWNSQNPLVVLSNFHQTHILDCRYKPDIDTVLSRVIRRYCLADLADLDKFSELFHLLSRDAVAAGALDEFAATISRPRGKSVQRGLFKGGYQRIDKTFLAELDEHREVLARSFKQTNPGLDGHALTEITQRVLDRLIFIRFLEDKLIESNYLVASFGDKETAWNDFVTTSRKLDRVYNGVVFKKHNLVDTSKFIVDDVMFADVCESLAHVNSAYDFNSIPIHILGSIYERFLGRVITVEGTKAKLEDKPEVRKAGGVYYTPEYVVRYLVQQTVGMRIAGKSPSQMAQMRFCDISCGSGSFLLGVFEALLDEHRKWFNANPERAAKDGCFKGDDGTWHLSLSQKRVLLVNNIFGIDLDPQAVEVAQISLYLKLLEDETTATARQYELEMHETLLPVLARNIVCGNSLIENDILECSLFSFEEERSLNPCDLTTVFSRIMGQGGFDVIVGNPPYVRPHHVPAVQKTYFWRRWTVYTGKADIYACFMQRATGLLKPDGLVAFIVSHGWLRLDSFKALRQHVLDNYRVVQLCDMPDRVFEDASVETCLFSFQREANRAARMNHKVLFVRCTDTKTGPVFARVRQIPQKAFASSPLRVFDTSIAPETEIVKAKMRGGPLIGDLYAVKFGLKTGDDAKFLHSTQGLHQEDKPLLRGDDVSRYGFNWKGEYVWYAPGQMTQHRKTARPGEAVRFEQPKVLVKDTTKSFACTYENGSYYVKDVLIVIPQQRTHNVYDLRFVAAVINSAALRFYYRTTFSTLHVQNGELASLPLPKLDMKKPDHKKQHDAAVALVDAVLACRVQLAEAVTDGDRNRLERRCEALEARIEQVINALYGFSEADKRLIEEALSALG